jgi:tight adherence protein C
MSLAVVAAAGAGAVAAAAAADLAALAAARAARRRAAAARPARRRRLVALLAGVGRHAGLPAAAPAGLADRIDAAGAPMRLGVADLLAVKAGAAALALAVGAPLAAALPGRLPVPAALAAPLAGFLAPDLWLARRARRRARTMELELPDLLDLLRVAIEAGLAVPRGLHEVGCRHGGLLAAEWRRAAARMALGVAQADALEELGRRCPAPGMAALIAALGRAERHGAPLGPTLAAQAREARAARAQRVREHAARAAPKMQLVVALLLVPSVLLLVGAALVGPLAGVR